MICILIRWQKLYHWMTVYLNDVHMLKESSPNTHAEFQKGHFVSQKSGNVST